jgi:hypothetical protein
VVIVAILAACILLSLNGCAHVCRPVEDRAAKYGTVLECMHVRGEKDQRCLISTPEGDVYHYFKSCE